MTVCELMPLVSTAVLCAVFWVSSCHSADGSVLLGLDCYSLDDAGAASQSQLMTPVSTSQTLFKSQQLSLRSQRTMFVFHAAPQSLSLPFVSCFLFCPLRFILSIFLLFLLVSSLQRKLGGSTEPSCKAMPAGLLALRRANLTVNRFVEIVYVYTSGCRDEADDEDYAGGC